MKMKNPAMTAGAGLPVGLHDGLGFGGEGSS